MEDNQRIYIFRFAIGEPGEPVKHCAKSFYDEYQTELETNLKKYIHTEIEYCGYEHFLWNELFCYGRLRQTWGYEGLDLSIVNKFKEEGEDYWIRNFIIAKQKIGDIEEIQNKTKWCEIAKGRLNILRYMLEMKKGDIIFIPKVWNGDSYNHHLENKNYFTIATIKNNYYFDYNKTIGDFAHTIEVESIQCFEYGKYEITGENFKPHPYRRAISIVHADSDFKKFINKYYNA